MQDGQTRKIERMEPAPPPSEFLASHRAVIVTLTGAAAGSEYELDRDRMIVGRGPDVDLAFDDAAMSREHAAFEVRDGALWVRDLGSTNRVHVNGAETLCAELKSGDRIELGDHRFQLVVEALERGPQTYYAPLDEG